METSLYLHATINYLKYFSSSLWCQIGINEKGTLDKFGQVLLTLRYSKKQNIISHNSAEN